MDAPAPLPFEDRRHPGLWLRTGLTLRMAFRAPLEAFGALARGRSLGAPWRLKLLLAVPFYLLLALGLALLQLIVGVAAWNQPASLPREALWAFPALLLLLLTAGPLLQLVNMLLGGVILHALLWAFRGTRAGAGVRQTVRAAGYTQAMTGLLALAPLLGPAAYPAVKAIQGLGLARLHRTDPWRGLAAALTQALCACLMAGALVGALGVWLVRLDQKARQITLPAPEFAPSEQPQKPQGPLRWL